MRKLAIDDGLKQGCGERQHPPQASGNEYRAGYFSKPFSL
jgi:hypothetical protein